MNHKEAIRKKVDDFLAVVASVHGPSAKPEEFLTYLIHAFCELQVDADEMRREAELGPDARLVGNWSDPHDAGYAIR